MAFRGKTQRRFASLCCSSHQRTILSTRLTGLALTLTCRMCSTTLPRQAVTSVGRKGGVQIAGASTRALLLSSSVRTRLDDGQHGLVGAPTQSLKSDLYFLQNGGFSRTNFTVST